MRLRHWKENGPWLEKIMRHRNTQFFYYINVRTLNRYSSPALASDEKIYVSPVPAMRGRNKKYVVPVPAMRGRNKVYNRAYLDPTQV
jgi:hypothetical protein